VERLFEALFARDPSGGSWLPALLAAAPHGRDTLGELVDEPGWIEIPLAVRGASGRLACFDYRVAPARKLLAWYVDHPAELTWPADTRLSPTVDRLRRALIDDDPPGARARAQDRAHELIKTASPFTADWWRFEPSAALDCVLLTDRLALTIESDPGSPASDWYPGRTQLVRDLEAAKHLATGRRFATLVLSDEPPPDSIDDQLPVGAPHLSESARDELRAGYLGTLTWAQAAEAVGPTG
jgi:hypothetical protein